MKKYILFKNNKGFTLVEAIVSVALLSIIAILFATTFSTSLSILKQAALKTKNVNSTAAAIEQQKAGITNNTSSISSSITINFENGQTTGQIQGNLYTNTNSNVTFKSFVPN
jgi:prepilin-type N-terminal cleavage/methylation domain-containing protein